MTECISDDELLQLWDDAEQFAVEKHGPLFDLPRRERLLAGPRMFEMACEYMSSAIQSEYPRADKDEVSAMLSDIVRRHRILEPKLDPP